MKRTTLLKAALLATAISANGAVDSPVADGYVSRGRQMLSQGNYQGCIDQLSVLNVNDLSPAMRETVQWMRVRAAYLGADKGALAVIREFLEANPSSINRGRAHLYAGNCLLATSPADALLEYEKIEPATLDNADHADLTYHKAYALLRLGEYDRAETMFSSLATDAVYGAGSRFYLGYIAYTRHDYKQAKQYFEQADRRTSPGADADYYLAQIYYMEGNFDKALTAAKAHLGNTAADTSFQAEAYRIAGESLFARHQNSQAITYLEKYIELAETPEPSALYILGTKAYHDREYNKAVRYLEPVTAGDNAMGQSAYLFIGQSLMEIGDKDAALMAFDNALRRDYDPAVQEAAYYNYAVAKFGGGNIPFGSSVSTFEDFLRRYPTGPYTASVQEYLVSGYLTDRNYDDALASIERMKNPGNKVLAAKQQVLYALGTRALSTNDPTAARDYLKRAAELARYDKKVAYATQLSLGEAQYRLGNYDEAAKSIKAYLDAAPRTDANRSLALYDLGYAYFGARDYAKAMTQFKAFVDAPGSMSTQAQADAYNRLADTYFYDTKFDQAATYYTRAAELTPESADYPLFQQALIKGYNRDYAGKLADIDALLERYPTSSLIPDALLEKTQAYLQTGRNSDAVTVYRQLIKAYPDTEQGRNGYVQLAMTLLNTGDRKGAIEAYRSVIKNYPTSAEAQIAVEELQRLAAEDGTLGEFGRFLESIDNAPQLDVADADRLTFEAAEADYLSNGKTARVERYLTDFPNGANRSAALGYMMEDADNAGRTADALTYATLIVENYPDARIAIDALAVKARAEHSLGRGEESLHSWEALQQRASSPARLNEARQGIMRVSLDLGRWDQVITAADALLASSTAGAEDRSEAIFARSLALDLTDHTAEARQGWASIADDTNDIYGVKSAYYLAQSYFDGKDLDKSLKLVDKIVDSGTPHAYWLARTFILLSDIYAAQGKTFEAREYLNSMRRNYPGTESDIFQMIDSRLSELK